MLTILKVFSWLIRYGNIFKENVNVFFHLHNYQIANFIYDFRYVSWPGPDPDPWLRVTDQDPYPAIRLGSLQIKLRIQTAVWTKSWNQNHALKTGCDYAFNSARFQAGYLVIFASIGVLLPYSNVVPGIGFYRGHYSKTKKAVLSCSQQT
jgi:hypothetical protein